MKSLWNASFAALAMVFISNSGVLAQCRVPGVPGDGCPDFRFDPATGLMSFSADGAQVQSILIEGPDPGVDGLLDPDGNWPTAADLNGQNWTVVNLNSPPLRVLTGAYAYFAGRYQMIMFTDTANTGWNNADDLAIIQYPPGTTHADFGCIEMSTWDSDVNNPPPSQTIIYCPSEPTALGLLAAPLLGLGLIRRR